jgi:hypothetical protein
MEAQDITRQGSWELINVNSILVDVSHRWTFYVMIFHDASEIKLEFMFKYDAESESLRNSKKPRSVAQSDAAHFLNCVSGNFLYDISVHVTGLGTDTFSLTTDHPPATRQNIGKLAVPICQ